MASAAVSRIMSGSSGVARVFGGAAAHCQPTATIALQSASGRMISGMPADNVTRIEGNARVRSPFELAAPQHGIINSALAGGRALGGVRSFHASTRADSTVLVAGLGVAAAALAARFAVQALQKADGSSAGAASADKVEGKSEASDDASSASSAKKKAEATEQRSHKGMGAEFFARQFYKGGFEDKMTRREAALILGVRCVR